MLKNVVLSAFTLYGMTSAQVVIPIDPVPAVPNTPIVPNTPVEPASVYGAFGQECPAGSAQTSQCPTITDVATDNSGFLICEGIGECCKCASIQCGLSGTDCKEIAFGPSSAKYVADIQVLGDPSFGAVISCNGLESCLGATISGENIAGIDCDGSRACASARILITDPVANFAVECAGTDACQGLQIEIQFSGPPPGYQCTYLADPLYTKTVFEMSGIECVSQGSCNMIDVTVNNAVGCKTVNIATVECFAPDSCTGATFDLIGDVNIETCQCGASCATATGLGSCYEAPAGQPQNPPPAQVPPQIPPPAQVPPQIFV